MMTEVLSFKTVFLGFFGKIRIQGFLQSVGSINLKLSVKDLRVDSTMHGPKRNRLMMRFVSLRKWRRCSLNTRPSMGCAIISLRRYRSWLENEETPPEGYLAVYVGAEKKRFVIRTEHINHPLFRMLLDQAENEYGFQSFGPLTLPCEVSLFRRILWALNDPASGNAAAIASTDLLTICAM